MNEEKTVAIVGYGYVGKAMHKIFPDAICYDKSIDSDASSGSFGQGKVNECDLAIVCVPTAMREDGTCDTSIVEEVIGWLETPLILIKSTIPPGTSDRLSRQTGLDICFSPEYVGEGQYFIPEWKYPNPTDPRSHGFLIVGGPKPFASAIIDIFKEKLGPDCFYGITDSVTAELTKYMENSWGAHKVAFCNQWYDLAESLGVNYNELRELWLLDKRVERMHTAVFPNKRGYGGKCFPKDIHAITQLAKEKNAPLTLLEAVIKYNDSIQ